MPDTITRGSQNQITPALGGDAVGVLRLACRAGSDDGPALQQDEFDVDVDQGGAPGPQPEKGLS